jgi:hypothetical protein
MVKIQVRNRQAAFCKPENSRSSLANRFLQACKYRVAIGKQVCVKLQIIGGNRQVDICKYEDTYSPMATIFRQTCKYPFAIGK